MVSRDTHGFGLLKGTNQIGNLKGVNYLVYVFYFESIETRAWEEKVTTCNMGH